MEKQEQKTIEEAAEEYSENWEQITGLNYEESIPSEINKLDFINGANYQKQIDENLAVEFAEWLDTSEEPQKYYKKNRLIFQPTMDGSHNLRMKQMRIDLFKIFQSERNKKA